MQDLIGVTNIWHYIAASGSRLNVVHSMFCYEFQVEVKKAQPKEVMFSLQGGRGRARGGLFGRGICKSLLNDLLCFIIDFLNSAINIQNPYVLHNSKSYVSNSKTYCY